MQNDKLYLFSGCNQLFVLLIENQCAHIVVSHFVFYFHFEERPSMYYGCEYQFETKSAIIQNIHSNIVLQSLIQFHSFIFYSQFRIIHLTLRRNVQLQDAPLNESKNNNHRSPNRPNGAPYPNHSFIIQLTSIYTNP